MSMNCQCTQCACSTASEFAAATDRLDIDHNHKRLPGILRYRGLENEAELAARLVKIESLMVTLQSVRDDLDASMAGLLTYNIGAPPNAGFGGTHTGRCCNSGSA